MNHPLTERPTHAVQARSDVHAQTASVAISNVLPHYDTQNTQEGNATTDGDQNYFTFDLTVTVGGTTRTLRRVEMEVEEWRA